MCGWFTEEAICASRWKRRRATWSANSSDGNFNGTVQLRVARAIHHAHAALPESGFDAIRAHLRTGRQNVACHGTGTR